MFDSELSIPQVIAKAISISLILLFQNKTVGIGIKF